MRNKQYLILVLFISSNFVRASISGFQIGVHNLIDSKWRPPLYTISESNEYIKYNTSGLTLGFVFPVISIRDYDLNFRMKLANHSINIQHSSRYINNYSELLTGSNEFLIGAKIRTSGLNLYPQLGLGFTVDYFFGDYSDHAVYGMFFYDLSISILNILNRDALGLSINYEKGFTGPTHIYPNSRISLSILFFREAP